MVAGSNLARLIEAAIAEADFLCAVIPEGPVSATVFLEVGVALGRQKPCLLFAAPKADLPVALRGQPYARASLKDGEALRFHLDSFLKNAGKFDGRGDGGQARESVHPKTGPMASSVDRLIAWETREPPPNEGELVRLLAEAFEAAGYVTSRAFTSNGSEGKGADLAVWIDELQGVVGNPLLIEVTNRMPTSANVRQLQRLLRTLQSPLGLLVSWHPPEPLNDHEDWSAPVVVIMSVHDLIDAIGRDDFARALLSRRNDPSHSAA